MVKVLATVSARGHLCQTERRSTSVSNTQSAECMTLDDADCGATEDVMVMD